MAGLETTLQSPVKETKAASVDILLFIVDYSPSLVRLCSRLLFPWEDCVGSTWTNAGARVHDAADQLHRRRRPPHEHCDWGNDLWHRWDISRFAGRKLSLTYLLSAFEALICHLNPLSCRHNWLIKAPYLSPLSWLPTLSPNSRHGRGRAADGDHKDAPWSREHAGQVIDDHDHDDDDHDLDDYGHYAT